MDRRAFATASDRVRIRLAHQRSPPTYEQLHVRCWPVCWATSGANRPRRNPAMTDREPRYGRSRQSVPDPPRSICTRCCPADRPAAATCSCSYVGGEPLMRQPNRNDPMQLRMHGRFHSRSRRGLMNSCFTLRPGGDWISSAPGVDQRVPQFHQPLEFGRSSRSRRCA